jgi:hypothetical protein
MKYRTGLLTESATIENGLEMKKPLSAIGGASV